jgi:RimJ/RimL family protein N-acetyltransferase
MNPQLRRVIAQHGTADPHRALGPEPLVHHISTDWPNRETRDEADQLLPPTNLRTSAAQPTDTLLLADGTRLLLRPIGSDDRDRVAALFARLSPESRYRRFLSPKPELTPRELTFFTDIDHLNHEAIAAVDQRDDSIVGVARYVRDAGRADVAELAIEVADAFQRMGIGTALASLTIQHAHANGLTSLTATTLWENRAARGLLRHHRFRARRSRGREIEHELKLEEVGSATANRPPRPRHGLRPPQRLQTNGAEPAPEPRPMSPARQQSPPAFPRRWADRACRRPSPSPEGQGHETTAHHHRAARGARHDRRSAGGRRLLDHREGPRSGEHRSPLQDRRQEAHGPRRRQGDRSPRASIGWHSHRAALALVVTSGTLTLYDGADRACTPQRCSAGHGFVERPNHVHLARNEGRTRVVVLVTYLGLKHGVNPDVPTARPGNCAF